MISKKSIQRKHARRRFMQRTGIVFGPKTEQYFLNQIHRGQATHIEKQSCRVHVYDVNYLNQVYRVVWDKNRDSIVTVLPRVKYA